MSKLGLDFVSFSNHEDKKVEVGIRKHNDLFFVSLQKVLFGGLLPGWGLVDVSGENEDVANLVYSALIGDDSNEEALLLHKEVVGLIANLDISHLSTNQIDLLVDVL